MDEAVMDPDLREKIIVLAGATGVGKSELAIRIAETLDGEVISVDSMQVYRGMDIGTAKVSANDRNRVPHHLMDIADPCEEFDAGQFVMHARRCLQDISGRGKVPILCGGTGLYLKALFCGLGTAPTKDVVLRSMLESCSLQDLQIQLQAMDKATYEAIDIQNKRRVIRALEVTILTGESAVALRSRWEDGSENWPRATFVVHHPDVDRHKVQLDQRVDQMIRDGLVQETRQLMDAGICSNPSARQAIGYRQIIDHINLGTDLDSSIQDIKLRTHQYAKRQRTWFRNQMPSIPVTGNTQEMRLQSILNQLQEIQFHPTH